MHRNDRHRIRVALAAAITAMLAVATPVLAADEINLSKGLSGTGKPLALHGHDPVAFFTLGAPTPGSAEFASVHESATYYFASEANRKAFESAPSKYLPAYGGFCAYGVSVGKKFDGDPRFWTISNGRLYLNLNAEIAKKFQADVPGAIAEADERWSEIRSSGVDSL
jgi:YHS domain-containing protein